MFGVEHGASACQNPAVRENDPPEEEPSAACPTVPEILVEPFELLPPPPATTEGRMAKLPPCCRNADGAKTRVAPSITQAAAIEFRVGICTRVFIVSLYPELVCSPAFRRKFVPLWLRSCHTNFRLKAGLQTSPCSTRQSHDLSRAGTHLRLGVRREAAGREAKK